MKPEVSPCRAVSVASFLLCAALPAQWATLPRAEVAATQAFHVIARTGQTAHAFSAQAQRWRPLGIPHDDPSVRTPAIMTGDWTALVRTDLHRYRAYSARLHDYADLIFPNHPDQITVRVEDDLVLIVGQHTNNTWACAYSAQTNRWSTLRVGAAGTRGIATSRFVAGVVRASDGRVFGFSARHGRWRSHAGSLPANLRADGNVLLSAPAAPAPAAAFSGVLGTWTGSPVRQAGTAAQLDHNVAFVREYGNTAYPRLCGYSAYSGRWESGRLSAGPVTMGNNVIHVSGTVNPHRQYAFSALPGSWSVVDLPVGHAFAVKMGGDLVIVHDTTANRAYASSGVVSTGWTSAPTTSIQQFDHVAVGRYAGDTLAYSAATGRWAPAIAHGRGSTVSGAGISFFYGSGKRTAFASRGGSWIEERRSAGLHDQLIALHFASEFNRDAEVLSVFHERQDRWLEQPVPGAGSLDRYRFDRNVQLAVFTGAGYEMVGISAQRGDAVPAPAFVAPRRSWGIEENIAWAIDARGTLHVFGSPDATHSWFQYPLDSELQRSAPVGGIAVPSRTMIRGNPGESAVLMLGLRRLTPPLILPGVGTLYCDTLGSIPAGVLGGEGLLRSPVEIGFTGPGGVAEFCMQAFTVDAAGGLTLVGRSAEPLRIH